MSSIMFAIVLNFSCSEVDCLCYVHERSLLFVGLYFYVLYTYVLASFPGPAQPSVACRFFVPMWENLGTRLHKCMC